MTAAKPEVPGERLYAHAAHLDALRSRFATVRAASARIEKEQSAFGPMCGWILTSLGDRHVRQDELIAFVEENLWLTATELRRVAAGDGDLVSLCGAPEATTDPTLPADGEPLSADEPLPADGPMTTLIDAVRRRAWVDQLLIDPPVAEFAVGATDAVTALRAAGLAWAVSTVEPLRQMLDDLTGMPDIVATHATLWDAMATDLHGISADLRSHLAADLHGFTGPGVRAYQAMMGHNVRALRGLADISAAIGVITDAAGQLIVLVRDIVRGLIADWVAGAIVGIARMDGMVPTRAAAAQLVAGIVASRRVHAYVSALVASMANLSGYLDG